MIERIKYIVRDIDDEIMGAQHYAKLFKKFREKDARSLPDVCYDGKAGIRTCGYVDGECPPDLCCCARRGKQGGNFGHYGNPGR